ncbi:MAG: 5-formyltetrahydrofolate cyclo-ligase [Nitrosomonas sp.]|nr:5-formyltetrahydrofolate cyclo-ligase [Nitrosomonas sp.]
MHDWQTLRKQQRAHLVECRKAITQNDHRVWSDTITALLQQGFPELCQKNIGIYWPIHGEYDPRPVGVHFLQQGATLALPEVTNKHTPLCFQKWRPNAPMKKGAYGIPTPEDAEQIDIDVMMVPMLGFDSQGYRLGYGSGYFDRTLAVIKPRPLVIGIAFEISRIDSVDPQSHDIPMDFVVTETGIYRNIKNTLVSVDTSAE